MSYKLPNTVYMRKFSNSGIKNDYVTKMVASRRLAVGASCHCLSVLCAFASLREVNDYVGEFLLSFRSPHCQPAARINIGNGNYVGNFHGFWRFFKGEQAALNPIIIVAVGDCLKHSFNNILQSNR